MLMRVRWNSSIKEGYVRLYDMTSACFSFPYHNGGVSCGLRAKDTMDVTSGLVRRLHWLEKLSSGSTETSGAGR
ncbi:hypothetical protein M404DRAFT_995526 [Pisolithus tinctorius Marx 270]|uniref:Uncharacterized protein n=1 Tax=Pisolithus tinctorius Marx 270 TaxID=870435 RepID=A0A0C3PNC9_PISTI|nr:hypothetical protein M404DRAFT_995526 [Pisolithus tinctorius Marx 270]